MALVLVVGVVAPGVLVETLLLLLLRIPAAEVAAETLAMVALVAPGIV